MDQVAADAVATSAYIPSCTDRDEGETQRPRAPGDLRRRSRKTLWYRRHPTLPQSTARSPSGTAWSPVSRLAICGRASVSSTSTSTTTSTSLHLHLHPHCLEMDHFHLSSFSN